MAQCSLALRSALAGRLISLADQGRWADRHQLRRLGLDVRGPATAAVGRHGTGTGRPTVRRRMVPRRVPRPCAVVSRETRGTLRPVAPAHLGHGRRHQGSSNSRAGLPHAGNRTRCLDDLCKSALKIDRRKKHVTGFHVGGRNSVEAGRGFATSQQVLATGRRIQVGGGKSRHKP